MNVGSQPPIFYPEILGMRDFCSEKETLSLVSEDEADHFLEQLNEISWTEEEVNLKNKVITYALKEIFFRKTFQNEKAAFYFDVGPAIVFQEDEITHNHWIRRCVELLSVQQRNRLLGLKKIEKILEHGIEMVIGEVSPALPGQPAMIKIRHRHPEDHQSLKRTIKFNYNKIDSSENTALDQLIKKVCVSSEELKLISMLLRRDAKIASTPVEKVEEFKTFAKKNYPKIYQQQILPFEAKITHLAQTKLSGLLSVKAEKQS